MPVVLFTSEAVHADWSREKPLTARTVIMEDNAYCMRILLILVYNHHRPLFVGAQQGICRDQNVARGISNVASGRKDPMLTPSGQNPFLIDSQRTGTSAVGF